MNKELRMLTRAIFVLFLALFASASVIQVVSADELRADPLNQRTVKNSFQIERGSILVDGTPIAQSNPSDDVYKFTREYTQGPKYAPITGYFSHYQGTAGIEGAMNAELTGSASSQFFNRVLRIISGADPQGSSVELTIDPDAQQAAVDALEGYKGAVVAIEPDTGRILALASTPTYDPNRLSVNDSSEIINAYKEYEEDPNKPLANRAIAGDTYHPGSTFKVITTAAALEAGKATPATKLPNPVAYTLPGSTAQLHNYSRGTCGPGSDTTIEYAFLQSCNVQFAELANSLDLNAVSEQATKFGFNTPLEIPLSVTQSAAPNPGDRAQQALSSIGQWDIRATPLQIAMMSAGVANKGTVMKPQLVERVITPDLNVEQNLKPEVFSEAVSPETAATLTDLMTKSVSQGVAGNAAVTGVDVAGKTGTAENGNDEDGNPLPFTIWFTGFAPAADPQIAVAVVVEEGGGEAHNYQGGSGTIPTQISKQVMEAVLNE